MASSPVKALRLKSSFGRLREQPSLKKRLFPWLLCVAAPNEDPSFYLGFSAATRFINASKRNRLKRRLRAIVRKMAEKAETGYDIHFVVTRKVTESDWSQFEQVKFEALCSKIMSLFFKSDH